MPLTIPAIDDRKYQDLRDEGLRRVRVHNPEWTNFNKSDPGVTLIEVFAFLTESLLYRAGQIPERNRAKFLKLLGIPLTPATPAEGLVAFSNDRGPLETTSVPTDFEVRAGQLAFRVEQGLDVLPVEGRVYYKRELKNPPPRLREYYNQLYASFLKPPLPTTAKLYESVPLVSTDGVDLGNDTVDSSIWIALVARKSDVAGLVGDELTNRLREIRAAIGAKTVTLGVVPWLVDSQRQLTAGGAADPDMTVPLTCRIPVANPLPSAASLRVPEYKTLTVQGDDVLTRPGTLQVGLPGKDELGLWTDLDPLESGVGDFPPAIDDAKLEARVVTWLRLSVPARAQARLLWAGINAAKVTQRAHVSAERLPEGTGSPDQALRLSHRPVLRDSVRLRVRRDGETTLETWTLIDDLGNAGAEVVVPDPRLPIGVAQPKPRNPRVFALDAEAGEMRFGDGTRGARPPLGATMFVDYDFTEGREGNVNAGALKTGPSLPPGFSVTNPIPTWGGADSETVAEGEKQVQRWLQHRDRLVSADDFAAIAWRTPGVQIGRVDVIPAATPEVGENEPGDAPGAVTLMLVPRRDPSQPDAPQPDRLFLDAVCSWLDPRRLVTTEVFLRGPIYEKIWLSVAIDVAVERSISEVRQAVEQALRDALSPLPREGSEFDGVNALLPVFTRQTSNEGRGWPLRKRVVALELAAVVARVPGVSAVRDLQLSGEDDTTSQSFIEMKGLQLPRVSGVMVSVGDAVPVTELRGAKGAAGTEGTAGSGAFVPIPIVPEEC